jgi:hydrogenase/urease accessory protein HupE
VKRLALALALGALFVASPAEAHLVTTGLGPVYDGIGHLFASPEDLVPAVALAFLAGLRGAPSSRRALFLLPPFWLAGGLLGARLGLATPVSAPAFSFLLLGALVAADAPLPVGAVAVLAAALGLAHGFENGASLRSAGQSALALVGIAAALFVVVALAAAFVVPLKRAWTRIAVRVAGSWIAAAGLLLLGWTLRSRR